MLSLVNKTTAAKFKTLHHPWYISSKTGKFLVFRMIHLFLFCLLQMESTNMVVTVLWSGTVTVSTPRRTGPCMRGSGRGTRWMGEASSSTRQALCTRESLSTISFTAKENTLGKTIHFTKDNSTKISKLRILLHFTEQTQHLSHSKINWKFYFYHKYKY